MAHRPDAVLRALEGDVVSPVVAGITYAPVEALAALADADRDDPADVLAAAVVGLDLDFAFVPAYASWAERAVTRLREEGSFAFWAVDGPLWRVFEAVGLQEGLRMTRWRPEELESRLDEESSRASEEVARGARLGAQGIVLADDLSSSQGPLVSPDYLNEHVIRRLALVVAVAATHGIRAVFHSDGDTRAFLQPLTRAGFVALHGGGGLAGEGFERLLAEARSQGLSIIGGMYSGAMGSMSSAVACGSRIRVLAEEGGLLLADDGGLSTAEEFAALSAGLSAARGEHDA